VHSVEKASTFIITVFIFHSVQHHNTWSS